MMPVSVKQFRSEPRQSWFLPITHLNSPTVFETQSGQVGTMLHVQGVSFDTATPDELNHYKQLWHQTLLILDEDCGLYTHLLREKMNVILAGKFADDFSTELDRCYHARFRQQNAYQNNLYLTMLIKPAAFQGLSKWANIFSANSASIKRARAAFRQRAIKKLNELTDQIITLLSLFKPRRLGERDKQLGYSELLHVLSKQMNGFRPLYLQARTQTLPLLVNDQRDYDKLKKQYPQGHIGQFLAASELFIGQAIELRQGNRGRFAKVISVKSYGSATTPTLFDRILEIDGELMTTHSYHPEANHIAQKTIKRKGVQLENAQDAAVSQQAALDDLREDLASERLRTGKHHHTVMVLADDLETLDRLARDVLKVFIESGFVPTVEQTGLEAAYFAQFPGNQSLIARDCLVTSENMADFFPLHNYRTGYRDHNHLGSAITLLETPSRTPVFFNYHRQGSGEANDYTPGHATIIGGNGSGKTTLMAFTDAQMGRYGGRSFLFDRDQGLSLYVRATGGNYLVLHPDHLADCQMNPFALKDTKANRAFLTDWLSILVRRPDDKTLPASVRQELKASVDYLYRHLSPEERTLAEAIKHLGRDFDRHIELSEWLGHHDTQSAVGSYAWCFDHKQDSLDVSVRKLGFDLTYLMTQPENVLTAVMMYLFHRIEESLQEGGERVSIFVDEGWMVLQNTYWANKLDKWLPTLRKLNCHLVLGTQSPSSVVQSPLCAKFLDNSATNIFACNNKANWHDYKHFNLSEYEFEFLKQTPLNKRLLLYKQDNESCVCRLNLAGLDNALTILAGNRHTIALADNIRAEVGYQPQDWLPVFYQRYKEQTHA